MCGYLERSEMYDTVNVRIVIEDLVDCALIPDINVVEMRSLTAYQFDAVKSFFGRIVEVVEDHDIVVGLKQGKGSEGTNIAGAAGSRQISKS